ncbi:hypothetical protein ACI3LY_002879 [Candidozyma auris]|uniref:Uncharacterized protein n=2 Tax=Candidozyma auris TaxID=498019 RepID=A0A2H0ZMW5_CANAR|nr:hypothetical_protein [[Candida] auris]KND98383.2 hypothetical protein QG37_04734 [[Candida] auris]PIS51964.1 hypothetical protein B9J08_003575 [[Candida] auris]PIS53950.1 hypothetical protein CJI97_003648 [[Candida] auris]QEO21264.1 hypothetical_protein [[Candida] auris]QWW21718.1 hypothetical protein CA7LBN_000464 [[Candida] auris]
MFFRFLVLFFTLATIALTPWAIVGSYKAENYLTSNYLIGVQVTNLNVGKLFAGANQKRNVPVQPFITETPTPTTDEAYVTAVARRDVLSDIESVADGFGNGVSSFFGGANINSLTSQFATAANSIQTGDIASKVSELVATASIPSSLATLAEGLADSLNLENLVNGLNYTDLGLADYYSVGYWGYCRGYMREVNSSDALIDRLGNFGENFNKDNVHFVWCSDPVPGFKFDPLDIVKREMTNAIREDVDGLDVLPSSLSDTIKAQLVAIVASVTYEDLNLPGSLKDDLTLLNNLTKAALAMLLAGVCLAFISFIFQFAGLCCSPHNSCLSCLNYFLMVLFFLCILLGAGLSTGAYVFVRKEVNKEIDQYGLKSFLSVQYYAFAWSAMVAAFLVVVLAAIGYCCGCFAGERRYRRVQEPPMAYDHKGYH